LVHTGGRAPARSGVLCYLGNREALCSCWH
jgi:hypothetical protein